MGPFYFDQNIGVIEKVECEWKDHILEICLNKPH